MAVKRKYALPTPKLFNFAEMEHGVFYKVYRQNYTTLYTKSLQGDIVWFEEGRIGTHSKFVCTEMYKLTADRKYALADVGDGYTFEQDACILA